MAIVIKVTGWSASTAPCPIAGMYVRDFDFEWKRGLGIGTYTHHVERAKRFKDVTEARAFWRTQSKHFPLRRDGGPNCPLMTSAVEFEHAEGKWH